MLYIIKDKVYITPGEWNRSKNIMEHSTFNSAGDLQQAMRDHGYIADDRTALVLQLSSVLGKPVLIEGPAGAGKTELAKAWSRVLERSLIRLQCYEGIDEGKALYEWNYQKQLLYIQSANPDENSRAKAQKDIFSGEFLLERPLLQSIRSERPSVLLIDEVDKSDQEFESFLLEVLSDWQVTIPEMGTLKASSIPSVILTSNNTRELSHALRRRCLYLYLDYPEEKKELDILRLHQPGLKEELGKTVVAFIRQLRLEKLRKRPSVSEVIDWVNTLAYMGVEKLDDSVVADTLSVLLKYREDCDTILEKLYRKDLPYGIPHS